jgi:hypothetical protein
LLLSFVIVTLLFFPCFSLLMYILF